MKDLTVYVHGKGGSAQEAEHYKSLFPKDEVIGFDYRSQTPWQAKKEFFAFFGRKSYFVASYEYFPACTSINGGIIIY